MKTKKIAGILVTMIAPFENHIANGGDKLFGNANSIKRRPDGRVYISGQMQRHALFSAMDRLNSLDPDKSDTYLSNGDGVTNQIERDLRADLGGFMHPSKGDYSGRRMAPLSATPAVSILPSFVGRDLLVRLRFDNSEDARDQAIVNKEFSERDMMHMNFFLDATSVGVSKAFEYKKGWHLGVKYFKHITDGEKKRRIRLFLEASRLMNDYANQARNAVCGEPEKVLIVFDDKLSRKASRYFVTDECEQKNILNELDRRGVTYFLGDDKGKVSVDQAYQAALEFLSEADFVDFASGEEVMSYATAFEPDAEAVEKKKKSKKNASAEE